MLKCLLLLNALKFTTNNFLDNLGKKQLRFICCTGQRKAAEDGGKPQCEDDSQRLKAHGREDPAASFLQSVAPSSFYSVR